MGELRAYGQADCATCSGRGILTDREGRPTQCVPCSSERRESTTVEHGFSLVCTGCTAVLTVQDIEVGKASPRPQTWSVFGPLCSFCMASLERKSA